MDSPNHFDSNDKEINMLSDMYNKNEFNCSKISLGNSQYKRSIPVLTEKPIIIDIPINTEKQEIFLDQCNEYEFAINSLTVYDFITNYVKRKRNGRKHDNEQKNYRVSVETLLQNEGEMKDSEIKKFMKGKHALHYPDQIMGGWLVSALGDGNINRQIGSLMKSRADTLYKKVKKLSEEKQLSEEEMKHINLNVRFRYVKKHDN